MRTPLITLALLLTMPAQAQTPPAPEPRAAAAAGLRTEAPRTPAAASPRPLGERVSTGRPAPLSASQSAAACRSACARNRYLCAADGEPEVCGVSWSQCVTACSRR